MDKLYGHLLQTVLSAVLVIIALLIIKHNQPPRLVKIDLLAITAHYTQMMTKVTLGNTNPENPAVKKISDNVRNGLEPILNAYAHDHHAIIVQTQAIVVGDVPDITGQILGQLDRRMQ